MKWIAFSAAALALAGCVGNRVELGGVEKPLLAPTTAVACDNAGLTLASRGNYVVAREAGIFYAFAGTPNRTDKYTLGYDVNSAGEPVNIRYTGEPAALKHSMRQKMIRTATDALAGSRYTWPGQPGFAVGCTFDLYFFLDMGRPQDAGAKSAAAPG